MFEDWVGENLHRATDCDRDHGMEAALLNMKERNAASDSIRVVGQIIVPRAAQWDDDDIASCVLTHPLRVRSYGIFTRRA